MEHQQPRRLDDYCRVFQIDFFNLHLRCVFCNFYVNLQDLASFFLKQLSLIWKDNQCYACCTACVKHSARYEAQLYCRCVVNARNIESLLRIPLKDIVIRCLLCYSLLDYLEKIDNICQGEELYLVRSTWRGYCRACIRKV